MVRNDYETLSEAMNGLRERGYEKDLTEAILNDEEGKYVIVESYRFEGMTNPGDSSVLYAIESENGERGLLSMPTMPATISEKHRPCAK